MKIFLLVVNLELIIVNIEESGIVAAGQTRPGANPLLILRERVQA